MSAWDHEGSPYLPPRRQEHHAAERGESDELREREERERAREEEAPCSS